MDVIGSPDGRARGSLATEPGTLLVVSMCAAWCTTCDEFRATFERLAAARPEARFVWLDIEDDHAICGDIDVENFPTLAVFRGNVALHFGVSLPQETAIGRLLAELASRDDAAADVPDAVRALPVALRRAR
jgi:thioredoxin reductase (NADPH)